MVLPLSSCHQNTSYGRLGSWVHRSYGNLRCTREDKGRGEFQEAGRQGREGAGQSLEGQFAEAGPKGRVDVVVQGGQTWQDEEVGCQAPRGAGNWKEGGERKGKGWRAKK